MTSTANETDREQTTVSINGDRLWTSLMELAKIGAYEDSASGLMGVNRQSLTDEDAAGRRLLVQWMTEAGLQVSIDQMGNIFGRREGADPSLAPVIAGSHIDSVSTAGPSMAASASSGRSKPFVR